jgi:hypothetical protein
MNDIFKSAKKYQEELPREVMAHKLSAEYHRHWNMALGGLSTVLTTLVGTAIFTALVSQLGLDGKGEIRNPFAGQGMDWLYVIVMLLSIAAPILAAVHTFMHHAEDASTHRASVEGYANVLRRFTVFLAQYDDSNPAGEKRAEALKEYDEILKEYTSVLGKSLTLTEKAYTNADKMLRSSGEQA